VVNVSPSLVEIEPHVTLLSVLPDRIAAILKHRILTCALMPGSRLVEKDLCAELGISRTPLREALNRLVFEGLVVPTPYRGYAVAPLTIDGIRELCEVRRINEAEAARLGAERLTDEDLTKLESLAEARYTVGDRESYARYLRTNSAFHLALVRCTRNSRLEAIVMAALDQLQRPEYLGLDLGVKDAPRIEREHLAIVQALRERDADRARALTIEHIEHAEKSILDALQATEFWRVTNQEGTATRALRRAYGASLPNGGVRSPPRGA
jgi:DNA-binding GntR family transcriptional regulator